MGRLGGSVGCPRSDFKKKWLIGRATDPHTSSGHQPFPNISAPQRTLLLPSPTRHHHPLPEFSAPSRAHRVLRIPIHRRPVSRPSGWGRGRGQPGWWDGGGCGHLQDLSPGLGRSGPGVDYGPGPGGGMRSRGRGTRKCDGRIWGNETQVLVRVEYGWGGSIPHDPSRDSHILVSEPTFPAPPQLRFFRAGASPWTKTERRPRTRP